MQLQQSVQANFAEFEADLIRLRTREGMAIARARGKLRGKQPKLSPRQEAHLVALHHAGAHTTTELAELFLPLARRLAKRAPGAAKVRA